MMTPHEQRIAIAEWRGWTGFNAGKGWPPGTTEQQKEQHYRDSVNQTQYWGGQRPEPLPIPDYPNDLNAMYDAEEHLLAQHRAVLDSGVRPINNGTGKYMAELDVITKRGLDQGSSHWHGTFHWLHATAAQRSEALCRTLWPERFTQQPV